MGIFGYMWAYRYIRVLMGIYGYVWVCGYTLKSWAPKKIFQDRKMTTNSSSDMELSCA